MLVLSPKAVQRLESYKPNRPLPKIFQMTKGGKLMEDIFEGSTINTPSMLCVEDALDALKWFESIGGNAATIKRSENNLKVLENWIAKSDWCDFLVADKNIRSCTSICLKIKGSWYEALNEEGQQNCAKQIVSILEKEGVAYDIGAYRDAPAGLRIWGGATVEASDLEALLPWLDWAYSQAKASMEKQAA
jgi:phosphoserine aminotransferase